MLEKIKRGNTYCIHSSCFKNKEREERILAEANVTFYPLTDEEINRYLETGDYMRIKQGHTASKMLQVYSSKKFLGDYYSIVGFPLVQFTKV